MAQVLQPVASITENINLTPPTLAQGGRGRVWNQISFLPVSRTGIPSQQSGSKCLHLRPTAFSDETTVPYTYQLSWFTIREKKPSLIITVEGVKTFFFFGYWFSGDKLIAVLFFMACIYDSCVAEQAYHRNWFVWDLEANAVIGARTHYTLCNHPLSFIYQIILQNSAIAFRLFLKFGFVFLTVGVRCVTSGLGAAGGQGGNTKLCLDVAVHKSRTARLSRGNLDNST